ncbi:Aminopeptidase 2 mitochondrial [Pseudogymnoascus verrucosus]|uniref:Aminopeptidase 2 mitochondrial n=1 Tax=Pseudogymnoascus verrucosus TaxID=342668 RepID=A0A1B8GBP7_9PEZI|nr:Aminopeptidase 2 mitochondrial [Pseudogymnoascus verrucosus]OBT93207.1 Aminopeptidase 2 mitochondrial [Pseudogymnoascus verrucosus]
MACFITRKPIATTALSQVGHPVVTVIVSEDSIVIRQDRFLRTRDPLPEEAAMLYPVPFNILSINGPNGVLHDTSFAEREVTIKVEGFVKLNAGHTGLYRTCYSAEYLQKLAEEAGKGGILGVEDRAGLIADAAVLASTGYQKTSDFLQLLTNFSHESQYVVWYIIIIHLGAILRAWTFENQRF